MRKSFLLLSVLFLLVHFHSKGQADDISFKNYGLEQGLSAQEIHCVFKDSRGFIWVGTTDGLNLFDGRHFKVYRHNRKNPSSISNNFIFAIAEDNQRNIWVSSFGGLSKLNPFSEKFTNYAHDNKIPGSLRGNFTYGVTKDRSGNIWTTYWNGISVYKPETNDFKHYNLEKYYKSKDKHFAINHCFEDSKKRFWVGSYDGLFLFDKSTGTARYIPHQFPEKLLIDQIFEDSYGHIWLATWDRDLVLFDPVKETYTSYLFGPFVNNGTSNIVFSLCESIEKPNKHILWIGRAGALSKIELKPDMRDVNMSAVSSYHYDPLNTKGLQSKVIRALCADNEGIVWMGGEALSCVVPYLQHFKIITFPGLKDAGMYSILEDKDKNGQKQFWVGSWYGGGLFKTDGDFKNITRPSSILPLYNDKESKQVNSIIKDHTGKIWVGTLNGLIGFRDGTAGYDDLYYKEHDDHTLSQNRIVTLFEDSRHLLWIGTYRKGINFYNLDTRRITRIKDSANYRVYSFFEDKVHHIWACTDGGLKLYDPAKEEFITYYHQPGNSKSIYGYNVYAICEDKPNHYWIATDDGLNEYDKTKNEFKIYNTADGLCNDYVMNLQYANGKVILGTQNGLSVFDPANKKFVNFYKDDGLEYNDQTNAFELGSNSILFSGGAGSITCIDLNSLNEKPQPKQAVITGLSVFDNEVHFDKPFEEIPTINLDYKQNYLNFTFTEPDYVFSTKTRFYCKLEGLYNDWVDNGNKQTITYANLGGGTYHFKVKAVSSDGLISGPETFLNITIKPPFWRTNWFFSLCGIFVFVGFYGFYRLRIDKVRKDAKLKQELAEMEMKALRAQMNPHFVFNALNSVQNCIVQNQTDEAYKYLSKFAKLMRLILENSEQEFIPIAKELEALGLYIEIESQRLKDFSVDIQIDTSIDVHSMQIPSMIIQPFVENAIWHGLANKDHDRRLFVSLKKVGNKIVCIVQDNGIGRAGAHEIRKFLKKDHQSKGISITEERLKRFAEGYEGTVLEIIDLVDENNLPLGTKIVINIPLEI